MSELLTALVAEAKRRGLMGVCVWDHGGKRGIVAGCLNSDGGIAAQPRNWDTHPNPESALRDLAERMGVKIEGYPESGVGLHTTTGGMT